MVYIPYEVALSKVKRNENACAPSLSALQFASLPCMASPMYFCYDDNTYVTMSIATLRVHKKW